MGAAASAGSLSQGDGYSLETLLKFRVGSSGFDKDRVRTVSKQVGLTVSPELLDITFDETEQAADVPALIGVPQFVDLAHRSVAELSARTEPPSFVKQTHLLDFFRPNQAPLGFPLMISAIAKNPKCAAVPMIGHGVGSPWMPLHAVLIIAPKWHGWWRTMAEPVIEALLKANPAAARARVLEGVLFPLGLLPLDLAITRGWSARVCQMIINANSAAPTGLDYTKKVKAGKPSPPATSTKGFQWSRKHAEARSPPVAQEVLLLLPKPSKDVKEWTSGRDVQEALERKAIKKQLGKAKKASKKMGKLSAAAEKLLAPKKGKPNVEAAAAKLRTAVDGYEHTIVEPLVGIVASFVILGEEDVPEIAAARAAAADCAARLAEAEAAAEGDTG